MIFGLYSGWYYDDSNTNFPDSWKDQSYDDSSWNTGQAYLGYGETLITTK